MKASLVLARAARFSLWNTTSAKSSISNFGALLIASVIAGCGAPDEPGAPGIDAGEDETPAPDAGAPGPDGSTVAPLFRSCLDGTPPMDLPTVDWSNPLNEIVTTGDPWHSAQDVIAVTDADTALAGKFSYGDISKDLEGERIEVWLDDCAGGYRLLGEEVTDSDGRIALPLSAAELPEAGAYGMYFRVMGDNSHARGMLRVYPPGTQLIVFDIDATLTTSDTELVGQVISEILIGDYVVPEARVGAMEITSLRHADHGYELIYLTGRPYLLDELTRTWLTDLGVPGGTVHLTDDVADSWPSEGQTGDYKAAFLQSVIDQGLTIHAAYGNATSDIYAYEQVGIPKERTYILGDHGGEDDTVALGESYTDHIEAVRDEPAAMQPFRR